MEGGREGRREGGGRKGGGEELTWVCEASSLQEYVVKAAFLLHQILNRFHTIISVTKVITRVRKPDLKGNQILSWTHIHAEHLLKKNLSQSQILLR